MKKGNILITVLISILLIILIIIFALFLINQLSGVQKEQNKNICIDICKSNNMIYNDNTANIIGNDVCFCKEEDKIKTFVI